MGEMLANDVLIKRPHLVFGSAASKKIYKHCKRYISGHFLHKTHV